MTRPLPTPTATGHAGLIRADRRRVLGVLAALPLALMARPATGQEAMLRPFSTRMVHSGHSLTDPIVPMLDAMVAHADPGAARGRVIHRSTIPGSPMDWRWNTRGDGTSPDAREDIAQYELLIITERAPLSGTIQWHGSEDMALQWFEHAWTRGNDGTGAESILYATWVHTDSGPGFDNIHNDPEGHLTFAERLPLEATRWQAILDHVNANRPADAPPMRLIPGPQIMAAVHDAIAAGQAPGLARIEDLFSDNIHLNDQGSYLIALAHLAVIYGQDPRDLPLLPARSGRPPEETARWMAQLVHDVLQDHPDSGYPPGP